ncbi:uncharacterized protein LOC124278558 [Haliotis rubra]|uniref:uncharacterized protein LOC124278558 n=1 Tax=Haliotis rubra TaxID=36100 RepID=UPI001EE634B8|nr:uncharacterized protein LOC124278558 [Haliotis rubra]
MCRWGCTTTSTTYQCKWCGTRFCKECLRGDFYGEMFEPGKCRRCNQKRCQGVRVEYVPRPPQEETGEKGKGRGSAADKSRSKSPSKKGGKDSKKSGSKKGGKKSGKKGGKKKKKKK